MRFVRYYLPTLVWMSLIFMLSSRTRVHVSDSYVVQFMFFKTLHVIEYGILATLMYRTVKNTSGEAGWKNRFNAALFTITYGLSDEIHQMFVPTREGAIRDVVIDSLGVFLAIYIIWKLLPKAPQKLKTLAKKLEIL